jgi:predicted Fe-Mo cluster-binding NifX family protein
MKIAVTSTGPSLDDQVDPRFGRCPYFVIVDSDSMEASPHENVNAAAAGGAGVQAGQFVADQGVSVVLTGNCGPNAVPVLEAAGIELVTGMTGTVREAVQTYLAR